MEIEDTKAKIKWSRFTILDFQKLAEERKGSCLSSAEDYVSSKSRLRWACGVCPRIWEATAYNVKGNGSWCPDCALVKNNQTETKVFEIVKALFPNAQRECSPMWSTNPGTNKNFRYDILIPSPHKCIIEVDGPHHFEKVKKWDNDHDKIRGKDVIKTLQAYAQGYKVIRVVQAHIWRNIGILSDKLESLVCGESRDTVFLTEQGKEAIYDLHRNDIERAQQLGICLVSETFPCEDRKISPTFISEDDLPEHRELMRTKFEDMSEEPTEEEMYALAYLEVLLPDKYLDFIIKARKVHGYRYDYSQVEYVSSRKQIRVGCRVHGYFDVTSSGHIQSSTGCSSCSGKKKLTIEYCKEFAENIGYQCVSTEYVNANSKLEWICTNGHPYSASIHVMKDSESRCPKCSGCEKLTIEYCREFGKEIGYECISTEYVNTASKLDWVCDKGHQFSACIGNMKGRGSRCPSCTRNRLGIEHCVEFAEKIGYKCVSTDYVNNHTKLSWICDKGHRYEACIDIMKKGSRCIECSTRKKLTIEHCVEFAEYIGYQCISTEYINCRNKMEWKCPKGHQYLSTIANLKSGSRCVECRS